MAGIGPGKGDNRRPQLTSDAEVEDNWSRTLPGKGLKVCSCGNKFSTLRNGSWWCKNGHKQEE
jgi:hypothetical protein